MLLAVRIIFSSVNRRLVGVYGAKSFDYDSFGFEWEAASVIALSDVRKCAGKEGYELMETGVSPATTASGGAQSGGGSNGEGEFI